MILFLIIPLSLILWGLIDLKAIYFAIKEVERSQWQEWCRIVLGFLKKRTDRKVFLSFMATEAALAGGLPQLISISVRQGGSEVKLLVGLSQNIEWLSVIIAVLIAIGYYGYLWKSNQANPEEWKKLLDTCRFIDEECNFTPSQEWFEKQNAKQIRNLDKRYSENRNFPYEDMDFALASLHIADRFKPLLNKELRHFVSSLRDLEEKLKREDYQELIEQARLLIAQIDIRGGSIHAYLELKEPIGDFLELLDKLYYSPIGQIRDGLYAYGRPVRDYGGALLKVLSNEWIRFRKHRTIMITGTAGTGKSHLIGDMVTLRKRAHEPSILLLGQHFTESSDPLTQIQTLLDVKCRKERLLGELNKYGARVGMPVVIFIDAINEGAGDKLWSKFLLDLQQEVESHEYLRLVISFRTSERKNWFYDIAHNSEYAVYTHRGFSGREHEAVEYLFPSFGINFPTWPIYGQEFSNPLFLIKYCRNRERKPRTLGFTDFWTTILEYCADATYEIAITFNYDEAQDLVLKALRSVAELMVTAGGRWNLEYNTVMIRLEQDAQHTKNPNEFFGLLVDEGLLRIERYDGNTYVDFGFERVGDYFVAEHLMSQAPALEWFNPRWGNLSEALAILSPYKKNTELFELVESRNRGEAIQAFITTSVWRDRFTTKGGELIQKIKDIKRYDLLFRIILSCPYRADKASNGLALYDMLWGLDMAQRDAVWTVLISTPGEECARRLIELAQWGCEASPDILRAIEVQAMRACLETLVWALSSTWRELRDNATHAIVNMLSQHKGLLLPLLERYYLVNDPYIQERLWCAVYGALLLSQDTSSIHSIARWTYDKIFAPQCVPEHILVRDYASNIVKLGLHNGVNTHVEQKLINPPFTAGQLPYIPSSDEITARYDNREWSKIPKDELDEYYVLHAVLSSMATEYGRLSYGDFGRYVFQFNLEDFGEDVELLSNWAIQMIFEEYGYDPKTFVLFDKYNSSRDRHHTKIERIGKKYQWIAMHRIMAVMMDRHPDKDWSDTWSDPIRRARTIDPTICSRRKPLCYPSKYKLPTFDISRVDDDAKWLKSWKDMPLIRDYVLLKDDKGVEWVNLYSHSKFVHEPDDNRSLIRDLWTFIQAYAVDTKDLRKISNYIHQTGIRGRSFHENSEVYNVFVREYYWAPVYTQTIRDEHYKRIPLSVGHQTFDDLMMEPTYLQYALESGDDASSDSSIHLLMPSEGLFKGLQLQFSHETGVWLNCQGETVVVDNYMLSGGHQALLVRKDYLLAYLYDNEKTLFWPILAERMIRSKTAGYADHVQCGGYAYMDSKGSIHQKIRCYEPSDFAKKYSKIRTRLSDKFYGILSWLHQHHLIGEIECLKRRAYSELPGFAISRRLEENDDKEFDENEAAE